MGRIADPVPLQHALAARLLDEKRIDEAREIEQKLRAEQPTRWETHDLTGLLAMEERRFADAVAATRQLIETQETPLAQLRIGEAEYRLGNYDAALAAVNRSIELAGESGSVRNMLRLKGRIENSAGDPEAAVQTFRRLRRAGDGSFAARDVAAVARALYASGRADAAREVLGAALDKDDASFAATIVYLRHESSNNPATAREVLERALKKKPFHPALVKFRSPLRCATAGQSAEQIVSEAIAANRNPRSSGSTQKYSSEQAEKRSPPSNVR
jgi:tetratricopeptide (TPR) repeat protein